MSASDVLATATGTMIGGAAMFGPLTFRAVPGVWIGLAVGLAVAALGLLGEGLDRDATGGKRGRQATATPDLPDQGQASAVCTFPQAQPQQAQAQSDGPPGTEDMEDEPQPAEVHLENQAQDVGADARGDDIGGEDQAQEVGSDLAVPSAD